MTAHPYAEIARAKKMADANDMGINDALISKLVDAFYAAIRQDDLLGPIFAAHVVDWTPHLGRMKDFWASVTLESGRFRGNPMLKHIAVGGLEQTHFDRWLVLWRETVEKIVPDTAAAAVFRSSAERIARSLLSGIRLHCGGLDAVLPPQAERVISGPVNPGKETI